VHGDGVPKPARVALVHDFLVDVRGAERVFETICELWPEADLIVPIYDERGTEGRFAHRRIKTSPLQRLRPTARTFRALLPFYPFAIESFDLSGYDLVVSSSSAWAHGVICDEGTVHVCYCHNPFRYAWSHRELTLSSLRNPLGRMALERVFRSWRQWDWIAAQRVDRYVANSTTTQRRIARYFGRKSSVVYPPVHTERFKPLPQRDHFAVVSELVRHKRIEVAVQAFNMLGLPLIVVGDGPELARLRRQAHPNIRFTGRVADARVAEIVGSCRALVVTAAEEFGIAAVEAQAAGRPVIGFRAGGLTETIDDGRTGILYTPREPAALAEAVRQLDNARFSEDPCIENAQRYNAERFKVALRAEVDQALSGTSDRVPRVRTSLRRPRVGVPISLRRS
jgi:glycosyltransferase involved in cell wall biosynthesis